MNGRGPSNRHSRIFAGLAMLGLIYSVLVATAGWISVGWGGEVSVWSPSQIEQVFQVMRLHGLAAALLLILWLVGRGGRVVRPGAPKALLLFGIVFFVVSADRIVGAFYPPPLRFTSFLKRHPRRGWTLKAGVEGPAITPGPPIRINALGLRGPAIPTEKAPGEKRVLFLGDSILFALRMPGGASPTDLVESKLARSLTPGIQVRCLNAGVDGYSGWQEFDFLKEVYGEVRPDIVVLQFCLNDVVDLLFAKEGQVARPAIATIAEGSSHWSGIWRAVEQISADIRYKDWREWAIWAAPTGDFDAAVGDPHRVYAEPLDPIAVDAWKRALEAVADMRAFCEERSTPFIVMITPTKLQLREPPPAPQPYARLADWCEAHDVGFIDTTPAFRSAIANSDASEYLTDGVHPSRKGYEVMADPVVAYLKKMILTGGPPD